ncbi:hypothetical protein AAG747_13795 [Rapidithrix thailandica]|uniref:DinB family protein n=1 Tax=Rapidithrix thailandica TaxID=413964 RepID=A0AAW9SE76_9BACT
MTLQQVSLELFEQLSSLLRQLREPEFTRSLAVLNGNTIGKHFRHILEFYETMLAGKEGEVICYDQRKHDQLLEESHALALRKLKEVSELVRQKECDYPLQLNACYSTVPSSEQVLISTSYYRELMYNIEHAIHHMAIIRIALQTAFPQIEIEAGFGVARSTLRYQQQIKVSN